VIRWEKLMTIERKKAEVREHWESETCGTRGVDAEERREFFRTLTLERYTIDRHIPKWARFYRGRDKDLLEIGVGAGTDFVNWVRHGARAVGIDLTDAGVALTKERLALEGLNAVVQRGDAESLDFPDASFDIVYSYGVLHHTPNTPRAFREAYRVLRPGGTLLAMIYRANSWTGAMLWAMHYAAKLNPLHSPREAIYNFLESPGTKSYTKTEARALLCEFSWIKFDVVLLAGDTLSMRPSSKYQGVAHRLAWSLYPRGVIRRFGRPLGLGLLIEAVK
jgi:ubiquinone/menaquinone biosynthesis C-methylase UbiE